MKNNDNLKEKEIKQEKTMDKKELENVSGGKGHGGYAKCVINRFICIDHNPCGECSSSCPVGAIINNGTCYEIDPHLCNGCRICQNECSAIIYYPN